MCKSNFHRVLLANETPIAKAVKVGVWLKEGVNSQLDYNVNIQSRIPGEKQRHFMDPN